MHIFKKVGIILFTLHIIIFSSKSLEARRTRDANLVGTLLSNHSIIIETQPGSEFIINYREERPDDRFSDKGSRHIIEVTTLEGEEIGHICVRIDGLYAEVNEDFRGDFAYYYYDNPDNRGKSYGEWGLMEDLKDHIFEPAFMVDKKYSRDHIGEILITLGLKMLRELGVECVDAVNVSRIAQRYYKRFGFETALQRYSIINMQLIMVLNDEYETPITLPELKGVASYCATENENVE